MAATPPLSKPDSALLHVIQHSLGVDEYGDGDQYRNHFVTGEGSIDYPVCMDAVARGLMSRRDGNPLTGGDDLFLVTAAGRQWMTANSPKLSRAKRRYRDWLRVSDATNETFIEYLRRKDASDALPF
jgi:hypothetical protein